MVAARSKKKMSESVFLASEQSGANPNGNTNQSATPGFYTAGDVAGNIGVSVTTVKRIASELRIDVQSTVGGLKLFTAAQVARIKVEWQRRQQEARK